MHFDPTLARCMLAAVLLLPGACTPPREAPDTVVIWHQKTGTERAIFEEAVRAYNESRPEEQVVAIYREAGELRNSFIIAAVAGQGPDLVFGPADNVGLFAETRVIRPWDEVLDAEFFARFTPEGIVSWKERPWLVADQVGNQLMLVYDRQAVESPPRTLDELAASGADLTLRHSGGTDRYAMAWDVKEPYYLIPFLTGFGGWIMDDSGNPTLDTAPMREALEFIAALRDKHGVMPPADDYDTMGRMFAKRRAAMTIDGPWSWTDYGVPGRSMVALLPLNSATGLRCRPMLAAKGYSLNITTPREKFGIVGRVLGHLTSAEVQLQMATRLFTTPTLASAISSPSFSGNPVMRLALEQARQSVPMPVTPKLRYIWDAMREPCRRFFSGDLSPAEAARLMQREADRRIAESMQ